MLAGLRFGGQVFTIILLLFSISVAVFSTVVAVGSVSQAGGSGVVGVAKADVRVLRVQVPGTVISSVTVSASSSISGTYLVEVFVTVGACSTYGSTTSVLTGTPTLLTIPVSPICNYNNPASVRVRVTQP